MHHRRDNGKRRRDERGASLVEYALLLALIAVVAIGAVSFFGGATGGGLTKSSSCIGAAYDGQPLPAGCLFQLVAALQPLRRIAALVFGDHHNVVEVVLLDATPRRCPVDR